MAFVDFKKFIQDEMETISNVAYAYSDERNIDSLNCNNEVVIKRLSGDIFDESSQIPVQIEIVSDDPVKVIDDFTSLALKCNNKPFESIVQEGSDYVLYMITPFFNTPTVINPEERIGSLVCSRLIAFATLNVSRNISNVKSVVIDGETLDIEDASFSYTATLTSNRVSGQEISKSKKTESANSLTFRYINKDTVFTRKVFQIKTGTISGNTVFSVVITMSNNMTVTIPMILGNAVLSFGKLKLPSENVTLFSYDSGTRT